MVEVVCGGGGVSTGYGPPGKSSNSNNDGLGNPSGGGNPEGGEPSYPNTPPPGTNTVADNNNQSKDALDKANIAVQAIVTTQETLVTQIAKNLNITDATKFAGKLNIATTVALETMEVAVAETPKEKAVETAGLLGTLAGAWAGGLTGAAVGTTVPGIGNIIGGTVGAIAGAWAGEAAVEAAFGGPPVLIDLDGDGAVSMVAAENSAVYYDFTGDGFAHKTGWVKGNDGFLAYDKDGDNIIQDHNELSFVSYTEGAKTDLEGLKHFDTNDNGHLDSGDAEWHKFRIWQDANENGDSEDGELRTMAELDIVSLNLTNDGNAYENAGNTIHGETFFIKADGSTMAGFDTSLTLKGNPIQMFSFDNAISIITKSRDGTLSESIMYTDDAEHVLTLNNDSTTRAVYGAEGADVFTKLAVKPSFSWATVVMIF